MAGCVPSVDILLEKGDDTTQPQLDEGKGKARAFPAEAIIPQTRSYRKLWRKVLPEAGRYTLLQRTLRNQDIFALYIAAVGHDVAHPGVSNKFLVSSILSIPCTG